MIVLTCTVVEYSKVTGINRIKNYEQLRSFKSPDNDRTGYYINEGFAK